MKKVLFAVACAASVGVFFIDHKTPAKTSDLTIENIEAVGLTASEVTCDASNSNKCQALKDGKVVMEATGVGTYWE